MTDNRTYPYDILIVEDSKMTIELLKEIFELKGFTYKAVSSTSQAIKELETNTPKVILLDVMLSESSGYSFCIGLKENDKFRNIPVYYLTGRPMNEVLVKMAETKADGYIKKPFLISDFDVLTKVIKA
ncbi:MAG: response regulator [Candidatus Lokiarchaeota archaeon]|nr:response regulator [Candidatus Lokiarchaeota archaeon]MBD3200271.1 response regulator [Candidatus Lokiarchaeota archaeon]